MSYAVSASLQAAVYQALTADQILSGLVGGAVFDAIPAGDVPSLYVSLGPEDVRDASDKTGQGAVHLFTVSVVTDASGFQQAKETAAAVCDCLIGAELALSRGSLISLAFEKARARRAEDADLRRIDLNFRARVADQ